MLACMEKIMQDIVSAIKELNAPLSEKELNQILFWYNRGTPTDERRHTKKKLMPYYRRIKREKPEIYGSWGLDSHLEDLLLKTIQIKPRRTASGVATITVLTKPWYCSSNCNYCPNDIRMPKSYLSDEPACQRAEQSYFDPYLQVAIRLQTLLDMGHPTDKIELIILGSTWDDYDRDYRIWFVKELFCALNDASEDLDRLHARYEERKAWYKDCGISQNKDLRAQEVAPLQQEIDEGRLSFASAFKQLYAQNPAWQQISSKQKASLEELYAEHDKNVLSAHRVVGLVMETRPDMIKPASLTELRLLGATKVQIGIQSLDDEVLSANTRQSSRAQVIKAFELLRLFGFKIHVHYMLNLYGSNPVLDAQGYYELSNDKRFKPDEVKLYPCVLVKSALLNSLYEEGLWEPYEEEELIELLAYCIEQTKPYTRISRMIRDISTHDIKAGNKKTNLRQLVEQRLALQDKDIQEIRYREIAHEKTSKEELKLVDHQFETSVAKEHFLQYVDDKGKIAGFLRLSLPKLACLHELGLASLDERPAMIREVHVYGKVVSLSQDGAQDNNAQHIGLGKQLIAHACELARLAGYTEMKVISAVGTRAYYEKLGFLEWSNEGAYQMKRL